MYMTSLWLAAVVAGLCALPWFVKWLQRRTGRGLGAQQQVLHLTSVLSLGPQQRVMAVEVGSGATRTRLVLGVTNQSITCLHQQEVGSEIATPTPLSAANASFAEQLQERREV